MGWIIAITVIIFLGWLLSRGMGQEAEMMALEVLERTTLPVGAPYLIKQNPELARGSIYVLLGRLKEKGLVDPHTEVVEFEGYQDLKLTKYTINEKGREAVVRWRNIR